MLISFYENFREWKFARTKLWMSYFEVFSSVSLFLAIRQFHWLCVLLFAIRQCAAGGQNLPMKIHILKFFIAKKFSGSTEKL